MNKYVFAPIVPGYEAETFDSVEPLDFAADGYGGRRIRSGAAGSGSVAAADERTLRALDGARGVDFQHAGDLSTLSPGADLNAQFGAGGTRSCPAFCSALA